MFGEAISKSGEILDLGTDYGVIQKSGSWYSYDGSKLAQGRDSAKKMLLDNPELMDELEQKIMQAIKDNPDLKRGSRAPKFKRPGAKKTDDEPLDDSPTMLNTTDDFSVEEDS